MRIEKPWGKGGMEWRVRTTQMRAEGGGSKHRENRGIKGERMGGWVNEWMGGWAGRWADVGTDGQLDREPGLASSSLRAPLRIFQPLFNK